MRGPTGVRGATGAKGTTGTRGPTGPAGTAGIQSATVAASETTASLAYTDLTTAGPSVTLTLPAGATKALVILTASAHGSIGSSTAFMSVAVSGASSVAPSDSTAYVVANNDTVRASATVLLSGLSSAGPLTFTAKYRVTAGTGTFATRDITVIPVP